VLESENMKLVLLFNFENLHNSNKIELHEMLLRKEYDCFTSFNFLVIMWEEQISKIKVRGTIV